MRYGAREPTATMQDSTAPISRAAAEHARLELMRRQVLSDMETLRVQEQNLRRYEMQLRGTQPPMSVAAAVPVSAAPELEAEREKLARLRALLEAERRALVDERLVVREERTVLAQKAEALKQREAWLELREREAVARNFPAPAASSAKVEGGAPVGFRFGLNEVPFLGYFRGQRRSA